MRFFYSLQLRVKAVDLSPRGRRSELPSIAFQKNVVQIVSDFPFNLPELQFLFAGYFLFQEIPILSNLNPQKIFLLLSQLLSTERYTLSQGGLIENGLIIDLIVEALFAGLFVHKDLQKPFFLLLEVNFTPFADFLI